MSRERSRPGLEDRELLVLAGTIGAGKTWLARVLATMGWVYVDLDARWHGDAQRRGLAPEAFVRELAGKLATTRRVVVDGWWTWGDEGPVPDDTLALLDELTPHRVRVVFLGLTADDAEHRVDQKWPGREDMAARVAGRQTKVLGEILRWTT